MDMTLTGDRLRKIRKTRKLSLRAVAKYEDISHSYLGQLERGENEPGVWELIARLAKRYHTTTDYLLGLTDQPAPPALPVDIKKLPDDAGELIDSYMLLSARDRWSVRQLCRLMALMEVSQSTESARDLIEELNGLLGRDFG